MSSDVFWLLVQHMQFHRFHDFAAEQFTTANADLHEEQLHVGF